MFKKLTKKQKIVSLLISAPILGLLAWLGFLNDLIQITSKPVTEIIINDNDQQISVQDSRGTVITEEGDVIQNNYITEGDGIVKGISKRLIFSSDFQDDQWTPEKGIRKDEQQISLYWRVKNGYLLTKEKFDEHFSVSINFIPKTESINFSFILEDAFKLVFGDGDNQEIILKKYDINDPNWLLVKPENKTSEERPNRIRLQEPILIDKEINIQVDINAKADSDNKITVQVLAKFFSTEGQVINLDEPLVWNFSIDGRLNRERRLGVGLVDEWPWARPKAELINFKVFRI